MARRSGAILARPEGHVRKFTRAGLTNVKKVPPHNIIRDDLFRFSVRGISFSISRIDIDPS